MTSTNVQLHNPSIVLFEDEPIIELDLIRKFNRWGYETVLTADQIDENDDLSDLSNCIIICNLRLSNGWVTQETFDILANTGLPKIILTGLSDTSLQGVDWDQRHISFVYKPFTSHQLKTALDAICHS